MRWFGTTRSLAQATGLTVDENDSRGQNFRVERDWGIYRGSGFGLEGTDRSGWLVTFAASSQSSFGDIRGTGYLVAHAIEREPARQQSWLADLTDGEEDRPSQAEQHTFGGKCLLLGGPWESDLEERLRKQATEQDWFQSRAGGAEVDVEMLDRWLLSIGHGIPHEEEGAGSSTFR